MENFNPELALADVAIVLGANEALSATAKSDPCFPHRRLVHPGRPRGQEGNREQAIHRHRLCWPGE